MKYTSLAMLAAGLAVVAPLAANAQGKVNLKFLTA